MNHSYIHCLDTLCWSDPVAEEVYKIAICDNSPQHIGINRYCRYLAPPVPIWICVAMREFLQITYSLALAFTLALVSLYRIQK